MATKNLSVEEMVSVSGAWTTEGDPARQLLLESSRLSGLLPDVEAAHAAIYAVRPEHDDGEADIIKQSGELDARHDRLARGIHGVLSESALLEEGSAALALRDALFPEGLAAAINTTYRGQAGRGALVRELLSSEQRGQLAAVQLLEGSLLSKVDAWLDTAEQLGALETDRARRETPESPSRRLQILEARNGWVRVVSALQSIAALANLDEPADRLLFGPLRDAEATADRRAARRRAQSNEATAVAQDAGSAEAAPAE